MNQPLSTEVSGLISKSAQISSTKVVAVGTIDRSIELKHFNFLAMTDRIQLLVEYSSSGGIPFTHSRVQTSKADNKLNDDVVVHMYKYLKTSCFTSRKGGSTGRKVSFWTQSVRPTFPTGV